ncbi:MAG TPA: tetratricopeptide repeat protein [Bacteroidia bacterium]|nr:tetratricopeptide repeat protein [Bacteroidia bacterium]
MKKFIYIVIFSTLLHQLCDAQNLDSLWRVYNDKSQADTNRLKAIDDIAWSYNNNNPDTAIVLANEELKLAKASKQKEYEAKALNTIGICYENQGNYPEALKNDFASLKIYEEMKDKRGIAMSYNNIGIIYKGQGNYAEALKMYFTSLKIKEEINDNKGIAVSYMTIGSVYYLQDNYTEALKNLFACLTIMEKIKDKWGIANSYINIGAVYYTQGNYPKAVENYFAALKIKEEMRDKNGIAACYGNLGKVYTKLHKTKEAQNYLNQTLQISKEIGSNDYIKETYLGLTVLDSTMGNYKAAFEHYKLYTIYSDSLNNEETQKKSLQASMEYEFDKKEIANKAAQDKLDAINAEEKQKQKIIIYAVVGLLLLVGVFAIFMFNRFRITNRQKAIIEQQKILVDKAYEELHEKNKEVMDSIYYARRIQTALITSEKYIENVFNRLMK